MHMLEMERTVSGGIFAFFISEEEHDNVIMANFPHSVQYRIKYNSFSQFGVCSGFLYVWCFVLQITESLIHLIRYLLMEKYNDSL